MDTMDFVKRAWATLDLSSPFTPTLSVEELDKRIADLRAVEQWLALNQSMLRNTIQGLEIQRGTLAAVKNLSDSFGRIAWPPGEETAEALARFAAATVLPPQAEPAGADTEPAGDAVQAAPDTAAADGSAAPALPPWGSGMDPLAWWKVLHGNFEQIARMAGGQPGDDASRTPDGTTPAGKRKSSPKSRAKGGSKASTGTKPAPRRKGRQGASSKPAPAGASADAKPREER